MVGSSASSVLNSFVVRGRCCSFSTPVVAPCIHCLAVLVEHILGNMEATGGGTAGAAFETVEMAVLGMPLANTDIDT